MLILDEPTNHLDPRYQLELLQRVKRLGIGTLASIHDLNLAAAFCDRLYVLDHGRIVASGTPGEVLTVELLRNVFGVEALIDAHPCPATHESPGSPNHDLALPASLQPAPGPVTGAAQAFAEATRYPLTITSCNREVTFKQAPKHALSHDINMTQMMLALGLKSRMVGYSGVSGWKAVTPQMSVLLDGLPELAAKYPSVETLLNANVDFLFAGWDYGMRVGGDLTPQTLAPLGINVYELTESCAFVMKRPAASLDDTYNDLRNLGRIFDVQDRANALIAQMQEQVAQVQQDLPTDKPRVFLYDSGEDRAMTSGRLGMPQALIDAAGGRNILDDVEASWTRVNWETVVERNPQVIVIVDYSEVTAEQKQRFLLDNPALQGVDAIKNQRFIVIPYVQATPGIDNVLAVETLAKGFHGE